MTTTLSEGVKVPDVGSVNWAGDLEVNWNLLNGALANLSGNVKLDRDNTWTGEQSFTLPIVGSITGTASKAIADEDGTSIKTGYVNVAGNQTVSGDKSFTGSNTFNNILPNATNTYSLGSSSYQWSSVYAQSYYYNGTAWGLDKTNVWTGDNTYTKYQNIIIAGTEIGVAPNNQNRNGLLFRDKNNETLGWMRSAYDPSGDLSIEMLVSNKYSNGALDPNGTQIYQGIKQTLTASGDSYFSWSGKLNTNVVPRTNNSFDLGTSTNKWKTINGYEPSMLGEVWVDNAVTIDTTNWLLDGSGWNTLDTSIMSGWVYFAVTDCDADSFILFRRGNNKAKNPTICFHPQHANSGTYYLYGLFMVPKNTTCIVAIKTGTNGVLTQALLYPCFGNV